MPDCTKCKSAIRGETGMRCAGVCGKHYHTSTKCSGLDQYSVGIIDTNPMVIFMCEDCRQYIHNVDLAIRDISEVVQRNNSRVKEYRSEFDASLKRHEDEIKSLLVAVEERFKGRIKVLNAAEKSCSTCVAQMEKMCKSADGVMESLKKSETIIKDQATFQSETKEIHAEVKKLSTAMKANINGNVTYSQAAKQSISTSSVTSIRKNQVPLIIKPKSKQTREQTKEDVKKSINPVNLGLSTVQFRQNGDIFIAAKNEDDREKLKLEMGKTLGENYEISTPAPLLPRMLVTGMSEKIDDDNLSAAIKSQNNIVNIKFIKIVRQYQVKRGDKTYFNAIIELDSESFAFILSNGKLNIGWERCKVYDGTRVLCCFKCKGFNHKSENCQEREVCVKCLGEHRTDSCTLSPVNKCINCIRANKKYNLTVDINHSSLDTTCPGYQKHLVEKKKKICY